MYGIHTVGPRSGSTGGCESGGNLITVRTAFTCPNGVLLIYLRLGLSYFSFLVSWERVASMFRGLPALIY